jgi:S-ribosylhomocysteine lyase LuxS involved in autoinducer biosynthesis
MAPEGLVGQKEMKCILKFEKYFHMSQCYSGEQCGPWASCFLQNAKYWNQRIRKTKNQIMVALRK